MTKTLDEIAQMMAVVIDTNRRAKAYAAETNPVGDRTLDDLVAGTGIDKHSDLYPQANDYGWLGDERLNQVVIDGLAAKKAKGVRVRQVRSRARAERMAQVNALIESPDPVDPTRMTEAWAILRPMVPVVSRIAKGKAAWARRYLGAVQDDVTQAALCRFALMLAKSGFDLDVYMTAAEQLAGEVDRIPGNQALDKDMSKRRKREAKARKSLMSLCNHMVMCTLVDLYREQHNLRWENLDILETVMASVNGKGDDPAFSNFQANKPPSMQGSRTQSPGSVHPDVLRIAVAAAITDRRLDALCELMIDESKVNTDGSFQWTDNAERVFRSVPGGDVKWHAVVQATAHHADPRRSRGRAAALFAQSQFRFMPWLIMAVLDAAEPQRVGYNANTGRAIVAAAFDAKHRAGLVPTVQFASVRDAADALTRELALALGAHDA